MGSKEGAERRKAIAIDRIMLDQQVSLDEAIEIYRERFRLLGSRGGKKSTGATGFALLDKYRHKEISAKGGRKNGPK